MVSIADSDISSNQLDQGAIISLNHNSDLINLENCKISSNTGSFLKMLPMDTINKELPQKVSIQNSIFTGNNQKQDAIIRVTENSVLSVDNCTFQDNYSLGRGSIIIAEMQSSLTILSNSLFIHNYANYGGVLFSHLFAIVKAINCTFKNNFAVVGGVLFLRDEG